MEKINITVFANQKKKKQGDLFGLFFEDLSHAADGGLYGELVRNRSFEFDAVDREGYHSMTAWEAVCRGDSVVRAHVETVEPLHRNNPHYVVLEVLHAGEGGGIRNEGYAGGIPVEDGKEYHFSCYCRLEGTLNSEIEVRMENAEGNRCYASEMFLPQRGKWQKVSMTLTANGTDGNARLALLAKEPVRIALDMISLFPKNTFCGRENGLRADIAELLGRMKPRFMRFPGGCLTHIGSLDSRDRCAMYRWKNTLGDVSTRPSKRNNWNYNQTLGLGFYELFLFCEDIGAEPLPVISAGYDPHNLRMAGLDEMQEWIDEALDLIEFANGDVDSRWGTVRAGMGHPESFHLKYLAIGNEEVGDAYFERYEIIQAAVKKKYPEISVINSAGAGSGGSEFVKGWEQARRTGTSYVDEHFYQCPEWFIANADRYETYAPEPKAFLGEYASQGDSWKNALAEAVFMTGMEKSEGVGLACYAPMLCNVNYSSWMPNLIYFDNSAVYGSPSYYVQKLFMNYQGEVLLECKDDLKKREKQAPKLVGGIRMCTQRAEVEISDFCYVDDRGRRSCVPDFTLSAQNTAVACGETDSDFYTVTFRFRKKNGGCMDNLEGLCSFDLEFARRDAENKLTWTIDGWQRLTTLRGMMHGDGCDMGLHFFESELNRTYEAKLVVQGNQITAYIDGKLYGSHTCRSAEPEALYYSAVKDSDGTVIVKVVNAEAQEKELQIGLKGLREAKDGSGRCVRLITMEGFALEDKNSFEEPEKVSPVERELEMTGTALHYVLQPNSLAVFCFHS